jgi:hypothetical protein
LYVFSIFKKDKSYDEDNLQTLRNAAKSIVASGPSTPPRKDSSPQATTPIKLSRGSSFFDEQNSSFFEESPLKATLRSSSLTLNSSPGGSMKLSSSVSLLSEELGPLQESIKQGNLNKLKTLVSQGSNIQTADAQGQTLLHIAAVEAKVDIVRWLVLDTKIDLNAQDKVFSYRITIYLFRLAGHPYTVVRSNALE